MEAAKPIVFCLTPVKDEEWILPQFLHRAGKWADRIIVADQQSSDASRELVRENGKATLIDNPLPRYDEGARQRLLISTAREIPSDRKRILLALDADEALSANWKTSPEWDVLMAAAPGTVLEFEWVNLLPGCRRGWFSAEPIPFGFVDDGTPHAGESIHSRRLPTPPGAPRIVFKDIKVLHYQYTNWARMKSKQRWYQCWERINNPEKRAVTIFRQYHHMDVSKHLAVGIAAELLEDEDFASTAERSVNRQDSASGGRWDEEVRDLLAAHGARAFRKLDIWEIPWSPAGGTASPSELIDPRTRIDKAVHAWLRRTQQNSHRLHVRLVQKLLGLAGW